MRQLRFKHYAVVAGSLLLLVLSVTFAAVASADDGNKTIQGHYAVTGAAQNLVSTTGFDASYTPNPCPPVGNPCLVFNDSMIFSGDFTFNKDGTGSFTALNRGVENHGPDTPPLAQNIKVVTYEFIFSKTGKQTFTFQTKPGTLFKVEFIAGGPPGPKTIYFEVGGFCEGVVSQDGQNLNVSCGPPDLSILTQVDTPLPIQAVLSYSAVGIRVQE